MFKKGDKVHDFHFGDGKVILVDDNPSYSVLVEFPKEGTYYYTPDGKLWHTDLTPRLTKIEPMDARILEKIICAIVLLLAAFAVKAEDCDPCRRLDRHEATLPRNYYYPDQIWKRKRESYNQSPKERQDSKVQIYSGPVPPVRHGRGD